MTADLERDVDHPPVCLRPGQAIFDTRPNLLVIGIRERGVIGLQTGTLARSTDRIDGWGMRATLPPGLRLCSRDHGFACNETRLNQPESALLTWAGLYYGGRP